MKKPRIVIIGGTGKLGTIILNFTFKNKIPIYAITGFHKSKKLDLYKSKYSINKSFCLKNKDEFDHLIKLFESIKIDIIYFLDVGSGSLEYLKHFLKFQKNSYICIANKEMIIAGGPFLRKSILLKQCKLIPLDSEHFSLINNNFNSNNIKKLYITASGGPFYFNKRINLKNVSKKEVLSHPKWKMGTNNLIDSSNFTNKILEILELSYIFDIPLSKIDFVVSKEAFVHSIIYYDDETITINCFANDMLITLVKPLKKFYEFDLNSNHDNLFYLKNFKIEKFNDQRFINKKHIELIKNFNHNQQILFMIFNNQAQSLYINDKLPYNKILSYVLKKIESSNKFKFKKLRNFKDILLFIDNIKKNLIKE